MIVLLLISSLGLAVHAKLPPGIQLCHKSDPNFNQCLEKALPDGVKRFASGSRSLGVSPLEPLFIERLDLGESETGSVSLNQKYYNVYFHGLTDCKVVDMKANFTGDNCFWSMRGIVPLVKLKSEYALNGRILIFPINGHGNGTTILHGLEAIHHMMCEKYQKKGRTHIRVTQYKLNMRAKKVEFNFPNIVNGNEQLSREIAKTLNEDSVSVFNELKGPFERTFEYLYLELGNRVFSKIPEEDIFLD